MKTLISCLLFPAVLCAQAEAPVRQMFADFFVDFLRLNPEAATSLGRSDYDDRWTDWSVAGREQRVQLAEKYLARLKTISLDGLGERDRINAEIFRLGLDRQLEAERLGLDGMLRVSQLFGAHTAIFQTLDQMPARTVKDYENIIARIHAVPAYVDQTIELFDSAATRGLAQPKIVADLVIQQLTAQVQQTPDHSPLLAAFRRFPALISKEERGRLQQQAASELKTAFCLRGANCSLT